MHKKVIYEQPLNERMRTLLRLEFLFKQCRHHLHGESVWESRAAVTAILDILGLLGRGDLKAELLKELERHTANLYRLQSSEGVDPARLQAILAELDELSGRLQGLGGQLGAHLKDNEFLAAVRQRSSIPGGSCDFDLPLYHYWLQLPPELRATDLDEWIGGFEVVQQSISVILRLIRHSNRATHEVAEGGFFQRSLPGNLPAQLVRVVVAPESNCYPEISGGKHRFSIRMLQHKGFGERPVQVYDDVPFDLVLCII